MFVNGVVFWNALVPMVFTELGIVIDVIPEFLNAWLFIVVNELALKIRDVYEVVPKSGPKPIVVMFAGIWIGCNVVLFENGASAILSFPIWITLEAKVQSSNVIAVLFSQFKLITASLVNISSVNGTTCQLILSHCVWLKP